MARLLQTTLLLLLVAFVLLESQVDAKLSNKKPKKPKKPKSPKKSSPPQAPRAPTKSQHLPPLKSSSSLKSTPVANKHTSNAKPSSAPRSANLKNTAPLKATSNRTIRPSAPSSRKPALQTNPSQQKSKSSLLPKPNAIPKVLPPQRKPVTAPRAAAARNASQGQAQSIQSLRGRREVGPPVVRWSIRQINQTDLTSSNSAEACNISVGDWVPDASRPAYDMSTCPLQVSTHVVSRLSAPSRTVRVGMKVQTSHYHLHDGGRHTAGRVHDRKRIARGAFCHRLMLYPSAFHIRPRLPFAP